MTMTRKQKVRAFQPDLARAALEDRVVLSRYDSPIPDAIVSAYVSQFRQEYSTLEAEVKNAANTTLLGGNNSTPTAATRAAFDAEVNGYIKTVQTDFTNILALSPLAKQKFTPALEAALTGSASTSLQSELAALATPTATGAPVTAFIDQATADIVAEQKQTLTDYAAFVSRNNPLRQNLGDNHVNAVDAVNQSYINQLKAQFSTAEASYTGAVTGTLLAGTDPTAISSHRVAFDAQVQTIIDTLNSNYAQMLGLSSTTSPKLTNAVSSRLVTGSNSLLSQLNALATPTDLNGTTATAFQTEATADFTSAQADIQKLVNQFFTGKSLNTIFPM